MNTNTIMLETTTCGEWELLRVVLEIYHERLECPFVGMMEAFGLVLCVIGENGERCVSGVRFAAWMAPWCLCVRVVVLSWSVFYRSDGMDAHMLWC